MITNALMASFTPKIPRPSGDLYTFVSNPFITNPSALSSAQKIILGIDPGTLAMGYSVIHIQAGKITLLEMNVLKMSGRHDNHDRLQTIYLKVQELIKAFEPRCFAIEAPFFGKNVQSMLKLGRAQGVAIAAAMGAGLEVCEYSPRKIKQSITGNGNAGKEQVWKMLRHILALPDTSFSHYDASDALAVAVCHHFQDNPLTVLPAQKSKDWKQFLALHPGRIKTK